MFKKQLYILSLLLMMATTVDSAETLDLKSESEFNPSHTSKFSFLYGVNPNLYKLTDISDFTFSYSNQQKDYWFDSNLSVTRGIFKKISTNSYSATGVLNNDINDSSRNLITFGAGVARKTTYIRDLLSWDSWYEMSGANLTYNMFKESVSSKNFTGFGILTKFGLYHKSSDYFSYGTQFLYRLAVVKRAADYNTETSSPRSLTLSHLSLGIDLSFFL